MTTLIAELATNHGGDVELAARQIREAAALGATHAKVQAYQTKFLSPDDPQFAWLKRCELSDLDLSRLAGVCHDEGVKFLATVFDPERVPLIRELSDEVKIGSGESRDPDICGAVFVAEFARVYVGSGIQRQHALPCIPLYGISQYPAEEAAALFTIASLSSRPEPIDGPAPWGYSDHTIGTTACEFALGLGAAVLEVHTALAGAPKRLACDKTGGQLGLIAEWCRDGAPLVREVEKFAADAKAKYVGRWRYARDTRQPNSVAG